MYRKDDQTAPDFLYPWQNECLNAWMNNCGRGMVQAVTGSGKTRLALAAMDRLEAAIDWELSVKIVVPTGGLMRQWHRALSDWLMEHHRAGTNNETCMNHGEHAENENVIISGIGMCGTGYQSSSNCKYTIYVINSARYRLARQILTELEKGKAVLLIADECHHYASASNRLIFDFYPHLQSSEAHYYSLGLSATLPQGEDREYLKTVLGKPIYHYNMKDALEKQTICRYDVFHIGLSFSKSESAEYEELTGRMQTIFTRLCVKHLISGSGTTKELFTTMVRLAENPDSQIASMASAYIRCVYKRKKLVCLASSRIPCVRSLIQLLGIQKKILIFGERIQQADKIYKCLLAEFPGKVGRYHSQMGEQANRNTLNRFRDGEYRILITCKSMDEGVDVPDASIGIILSGTSVTRQRVQRLGRIVRNAEGKTHAALYYFHLTESAEDQVFLPSETDINILDLEYNAETGEFFQSVYDEKADRLLRHIAAQNADEAVLQEVNRVLALGRVRADWVNGHCDYQKMLEQATDQKERNYWLCMRML